MPRTVFALAPWAALAATASAAAPLSQSLVSSQEGKLVALDFAAGDSLGFSIALSGDTAVAGAFLKDSNTGAVYVFVRGGSAWEQQAKLSASDAAPGDQFGCSVAISGDTLVVGARGDDFASSLDVGSAYVFVRSGGSWSQQAKLKASDSAPKDEFGTAVAVDGDTVVVGSPSDNHSGALAAGSGYVFVRTGTAWSQEAKLVASDPSGSDALGDSVALSGDTALLGAPDDDLPAGLGAGSAYVFVRSGTAWAQQQKLSASDAGLGHAFGAGLALSGDTALVGAPLHDAAYAFVRSGAAWSEQQKLTASDGAAGDYFGRAPAIDGDVAVVGALFDTHAAGAMAGSAYVFRRTAGAWGEAKKLTATDAAAQDWFGASAALSGDTAVIGASADALAGSAAAGSAYAFRLLDCGAAPAGEVVRLGTPPNPAALLPGATSGPFIGAVWDPRIDHATFLPGAVLDFLGIAVAPLNLPSVYGTILCGPAPFLVVASPGPGQPFKLKLPFKCVDVGLAFSTQGLSVTAGGSLALTNALDITIGAQ